MSKYYQASGKSSPTSFLLFILTSVIAIPVLALAYTYLIWYIPFIYINLFITAGFGFAVGMAISHLAVKTGKVRNSTIAIIFGFLGGLFALYFSWAIWVDLVINAGESYGNSRIGITTSNIEFLQVFGLVLQPDTLFNFISEINKTGTWGIRGGTVSGTFLTIIWIIELLIILILSIIFPYLKAKAPFCEVDNKWFKEEDLPAFSFIKNTKEMVVNLENSNQNSFIGLEHISNFETESHSIFTLYSSEKGESFVTIENKLAKTNDKDEIEFEGDEFIEYISISSELKNSIIFAVEPKNQ
jgi:hypothetical protein